MTEFIKNDSIKSFALIHKSKNVLTHSQSGGAFTALSDVILRKGGIIYGCILDEMFHAKHVRIDNEEGRDLLRGSKYIQSTMGNTFTLVKNDLEKGKSVLFVGTPCQIVGLKKYLSKCDCENLYLIDIVCHGVASPGVWRNYLSWITEKYGQIDSANFRDKKYGWYNAIETYTINNKTFKSYVFLKLFFMHRIVRDSCYNCPYKNLNRKSDITIGDFWGIHKIRPRLNDKKGVSLVLEKKKKGMNLLEEAKENVYLERTEVENSLQEALQNNYPHRTDEEMFWKDYQKFDFGQIARKYGAYNIREEIRRRIVKIIKSGKNKIEHLYYFLKSFL